MAAQSLNPLRAWKDKDIRRELGNFGIHLNKCLCDFPASPFISVGDITGFAHGSLTNAFPRMGTYVFPSTDTRGKNKKKRSSRWLTTKQFSVENESCSHYVQPSTIGSKGARMALRLIKDPSNPLGWSPEIALLGSHGDFYYVHKLVGQGRVSMVARLGELVAYEQAVQAMTDSALPEVHNLSTESESSSFDQKSNSLENCARTHYMCNQCRTCVHGMWLLHRRTNQRVLMDVDATLMTPGGSHVCSFRSAHVPSWLYAPAPPESLASNHVDYTGHGSLNFPQIAGSSRSNKRQHVDGPSCGKLPVEIEFRRLCVAKLADGFWLEEFCMFIPCLPPTARIDSVTLIRLGALGMVRSLDYTQIILPGGGNSSMWRLRVTHGGLGIAKEDMGCVLLQSHESVERAAMFTSYTLSVVIDGHSYESNAYSVAYARLPTSSRLPDGSAYVGQKVEASDANGMSSDPSAHSGAGAAGGPAPMDTGGSQGGNGVNTTFTSARPFILSAGQQVIDWCHVHEPALYADLFRRCIHPVQQPDGSIGVEAGLSFIHEVVTGIAALNYGPESEKRSSLMTACPQSIELLALCRKPWNSTREVLQAQPSAAVSVAAATPHDLSHSSTASADLVPNTVSTPSLLSDPVATCEPAATREVQADVIKHAEDGCDGSDSPAASLFSTTFGGDRFRGDREFAVHEKAATFPANSRVVERGSSVEQITTSLSELGVSAVKAAVPAESHVKTELVLPMGKVKTSTPKNYEEAADCHQDANGLLLPPVPDLTYEVLRQLMINVHEYGSSTPYLEHVPVAIFAKSSAKARNLYLSLPDRQTTEHVSHLHDTLLSTLRFDVRTASGEPLAHNLQCRKWKTGLKIGVDRAHLGPEDRSLRLRLLQLRIRAGKMERTVWFFRLYNELIARVLDGTTTFEEQLSCLHPNCNRALQQLRQSQPAGDVVHIASPRIPGSPEMTSWDDHGRPLPQAFAVAPSSSSIGAAVSSIGPLPSISFSLRRDMEPSSRWLDGLRESPRDTSSVVLSSSDCRRDFPQNSSDDSFQLASSFEDAFSSWWLPESASALESKRSENSGFSVMSNDASAAPIRIQTDGISTGVDRNADIMDCDLVDDGSLAFRQFDHKPIMRPPSEDTDHY